jgi:hypothetical protein
MLPVDYPDDFEHDGLMDVWFRDVPWRHQREVMGVNPRMRVIRNPATCVFVVVLKLNRDDPQQVHPFFAVSRLVGWCPVVETQPGRGVDAVFSVCELMRASEKMHAERFGETAKSAEARCRQDKLDAETGRVAAMMKSTAVAAKFVREFEKTIAQTTMGGRGKLVQMYEDGRKEFAKERLRRAVRRGEAPAIVVAR